MTMLQHGMVGAGGIDTGDIGHSLRLRNSASAYLVRTFGSGGSRRKWTWSGWFKRGSFSPVIQGLFVSSSNPFGTFTYDGSILVGDTGQIRFVDWNGSYICHKITTDPITRDPSSHYHIVVAVDTENATAEDRTKIYVNGTRITSFSTNTNYPINSDTQVNRSAGHYSGVSRISGSTSYIDGYLSRECFVDGQQLDPISFAYLNTSVNEWVSRSQYAVKAVVDAGGVNSFMLDFDDGTSTTTLGYDKSSNGNNWTCNNISLTAGTTYDWMEDVPGNSYASLDPLAAGITTATLSAANMQFTTATTGNSAIGSVGMYSGKWYWEAETSAGNTQARATVYGTAASTYYSFAANNTVYGFRFDADAGTLDYTTDGVNYISLATGLTSGPYFPYFNNNGTTSKTIAVNFGQRPFANTPPAGYKALNQANLSASGTVVVSGSFTGNANANGPRVDMNGVPKTLTINGNAVTFGTHADKLANGFKLRTSSASYNASGTNTWTATIDSDTQNIFKYNNAEVNP